eukprot:6472443-Amphidinium_carterae.2
MLCRRQSSKYKVNTASDVKEKLAIDPLRRATAKPDAKPFLQHSWVVRQFVFTATVIPIYPAAAEVTTPTRKESKVYLLTISPTARAATDVNKIKYLDSVFRKVKAPFEIKPC